MTTATIVKTRLALALSAFGFELRLWQESHDGQWGATIGDGEQVFHCQFEEENLTLAKLHPDMEKLTVAEGELKGYSQFPGSDCLNGGVLKVRDGHQLMRSISSHHYLLTLGHNLNDIRLIAGVFGFEVMAI